MGMAEWIKIVWHGDCHSCRFRHSCNKPLPKVDTYCPYWKLGDCYLCQYLDAPDDEWFKRGCEAWCFGGCGLSEEISLFFHYMKTHSIADAVTEKDVLDFILEFRDWKYTYSRSNSFEASYIIAYKGKAFMIDGMFVMPIKDYCAIGAGRDYASGAMYCGASARKAVEAACALCAMVAEPIKVEQMPCANK